MLLSRHFVYIHVPKTGGTFIKKVCERNAPLEWEVHDYLDAPYGDHAFVKSIPETHQHLPVLATIRNPWDWYVSWFHYHQVTGPSDLFNDITNNQTRGFYDSMLALQDYDLGPFFSKTFAYETDGKAGLYSETMGMILGDLDNIDMFKFENLRQGFIDSLQQYVPVPERLKQALLEHKRINIHTQGDFRSHYDSRLVDMIAQRDQQIIQRYDYHFE